MMYNFKREYDPIVVGIKQDIIAHKDFTHDILIACHNNQHVLASSKLLLTHSAALRQIIGSVPRADDYMIIILPEFKSGTLEKVIEVLEMDWGEYVIFDKEVMEVLEFLDIHLGEIRVMPCKVNIGVNNTHTYHSKLDDDDTDDEYDEVKSNKSQAVEIISRTELQVKCPNCSKSFSGEESNLKKRLKEHVAVLHLLSDMNSGIKNFFELGKSRNCKGCGKTFPSVGRMKRHLLIHMPHLVENTKILVEKIIDYAKNPNDMKKEGKESIKKEPGFLEKEYDVADEEYSVLDNSNSGVTNDTENNFSDKSVISLAWDKGLAKDTKEFDLEGEQIDFDIQKHLLLDQDLSSEDEDFENDDDEQNYTRETEEFKRAMKVFNNAIVDTEEVQNDDKDDIHEDTTKTLPQTINESNRELSVDDIQTQLLFDQDLSDDEDDISQENCSKDKGSDNIKDLDYDKLTRLDDEKFLIEDYDEDIQQQQGIASDNEEDERHATIENSTIEEHNPENTSNKANKVAESVDTSVKCSKCDYQSSDGSMLAKHKKYVHDGVYTSTKPVRDEQTSNTCTSSSTSSSTAAAPPCIPSTIMATSTSLLQLTAKARIKKSKKRLFTDTSGPQEF